MPVCAKWRDKRRGTAFSPGIVRYPQEGKDVRMIEFVPDESLAIEALCRGYKPMSIGMRE